MDVAQVEALGRLLQQKAEQLRDAVATIETHVRATTWIGPDAERFKGQWWPQHRGRLQQVAAQVHGFGQSALNNATEQRHASGEAPGALRFAGPGAAVGTVALGTALRGVSDGAEPFGALFSTVGDAKNMPLAKTAGHAFGAFGAFASGYTIGEELAGGHYVDAGISTAITGAELSADVLKTKGPLGYGAGAAVQSLTEAAKEARNVDWSANGMRQLQQASLSDWGSAFGEAVTKMPSKVLRIFAF
jgi:hypothetical protein